MSAIIALSLLAAFLAAVYAGITYMARRAEADKHWRRVAEQKASDLEKAIRAPHFDNPDDAADFLRNRKQRK